MLHGVGSACLWVVVDEAALREGDDITLTTVGGADLKPVWSPNGRKIAFMSKRDVDFDIYVADADGGNVRQLTDDPGNDFNPPWSPDGHRIAWNSDRDPTHDFEIYTMRADGSDVRRLTHAPGIDSVPSWSPRGLIAFESSRTPALTRTDLLLSQGFRVMGDKELRLELNVLNVFNQKTARHIFNFLNKGGLIPDRASSYR